MKFNIASTNGQVNIATDLPGFQRGNKTVTHTRLDGVEWKEKVDYVVINDLEELLKLIDTVGDIIIFKKPDHYDIEIYNDYRE